MIDVVNPVDRSGTLIVRGADDDTAPVRDASGFAERVAGRRAVAGRSGRRPA